MRNKVKYKVSCGGSGWGVWSRVDGGKGCVVSKSNRGTGKDVRVERVE